MLQELKFKKLRSGAALPTKSTGGSAGFDVYLPDDFSVVIVGGELETCGCKAMSENSGMLRIAIPLGISVEIPDGYAAMLMPRSSRPLGGYEISGLIDSDYRGEIALQVIIPFAEWRSKRSESLVAGLLCGRRGDRVAQLVPIQVPRFEAEFVDELSETRRGQGGFGSTGK